jgi:ArsR family transcriptional regulator
MAALPLVDLEPPRRLGVGCCTPVEATLAPAEVDDLVTIARTLADPVRLQVVDVLRRQAGEVCVCDLQALFDISQPTLSHHLRKLRDAGLVGVVRRGQWAYYYVVPDKLEALRTWLS